MRKISETRRQKRIRIVVLSAPAVILLTGVIADFAVLPNEYGGKFLGVLFAWLFKDSQDTTNTLLGLSKPFGETHPGICIFWGIWVIAFIVSLFFCGRQFHKKPEPKAINAVLRKREPYLLLQGVSGSLRQMKQRQNDKELDTLIYAIKYLEEKLSVESDFGYGGDAVIDCENDISHKLQFIKEKALNVEKGNIIDNINVLNETVSEINFLLARRRELKKG